MTRIQAKFVTRVGMMGLGFLLAGCATMPMVTGPTGPMRPTAAAPTQMIEPGDVASAAERACIAAGQERGLQVIGIAGSRDVVGPAGTMMRDVMLRVSRNGAQIEVRCNYQSDADLARIMLI
jgi:hypothetical protein